MNIVGIGILFARGAGIGAFENALKAGWHPPAVVEFPGMPGRKFRAYQVNFDSVPDKTLLKKIRRADKLSKMAVIAASGALSNSGIDDRAQQKIGIILATALGPHVTTFGFLDDILDYGDAAVSPTTFSNSVHNAAASYIASSLDIKGPTLTVTQFRFSFQAALQLAQVWLDQGRCDSILVGGVDQYGEVLGYVSSQKLANAEDGKIKPFVFNRASHVPGEGAVFFLLSRGNALNAYCSVGAIECCADPARESSSDLDIIDADGMLNDQSGYASSLSSDVPAAGYAPLYGSMMIGSAFSLAAGALMLKNQMVYATPVQDNPAGLRLAAVTEKKRLDSVRCIGLNCGREGYVISLSRT